MAKYTPDVLYIGSIYPGPVESVRRNYGPSRNSVGQGAQRSTLFTLQPVARGGKPYVLEVMDSFEDILDVMQINTQNGTKGTKPRLPKPVPVETIVEDVLRCWTGGLFNVPEGAKPGIIQIADKVPSKAEIKQMESQQMLYFEYLFTEGERLHKENTWKEITGVMRLAAEWLGYSRNWSNRAIAADSVPCPLCTSIIPNSAVVCPICHQQIAALPAEIVAARAASQKGVAA